MPRVSAPVGRRRAVLGAAVSSVAASFLLMVLLAALAGLTAGVPPRPGPVLTGAVGLWLAGHLVPLRLDGAPLSAFPLLLAVAVAAVAGWAAASRRDVLPAARGAVLVAGIAGAHAAVAVLISALPIGAFGAAPWAALFGAGLLAGFGAAVGVFRQTGPPSRLSEFPGWASTGVRAAHAGAVALATGGALLLLAALLVAAGDVHARIAAQEPDVGAAIGVTALSIGYLPNAMMAAVSWAAGPGLTIGAASASPLSATAAALPPVPLLAAMPTADPPSWAPVVFVLPVLAGVLVGQRCRRADGGTGVRLRAVGTAAVTVALGFALLAAVAGGRLGGGAFDPVRVPVWTLAAALAGWVAVPAALVTLLPARTPGPARCAGHVT